ncbi:hypothetical protein [Sorangium sp. So ce128]|uniref:hypothetical protein n=1 Tax=Sorangium sp. So ce128 TaxID=3133281 RepID=UPI003F5E354E
MTTTKTKRPLSGKAAERVKKLSEHLSGARAGSRGAQRLQKNRAMNPLVGVAFHAAARLEAGYELSDLERMLVDAIGQAVSPIGIEAWGNVYRETEGPRKREFLPDVIAEWPLDKPYTMKDLADSLPALKNEVTSQPNVRIVDVANR